MKRHILRNALLFAAAAALAAAAPLGARAQVGAEEATRSTFLISRPTAKARARKRARRATASTTATVSAPLGLAYTVFTRSSDGVPVRVTPRGPFREGDALRLVVESNADGYLYVFNASPGEPAEMIYPDPRIDGGCNATRAHVPVEIPSSLEANEKFRWFYFYDRSSRERLYLVYSRTPLDGVPTGEALAAYCSSRGGECPWRPATGVWDEVIALGERPTLEATGAVAGLAQTAGERAALTRKIGLARDDPAPSSIHMAQSTAAGAVAVPVTLETE